MSKLYIDCHDPKVLQASAQIIARGLHAVLEPDETTSPEPRDPLGSALYLLGQFVGHLHANRPHSVRRKPTRYKKPKLKDQPHNPPRTAATLTAIGAIADNVTRCILRSNEDPANSA